MSSTAFTIPKGTWVQVTTGDKSGSIMHRTGSQVVYLESATMPASYETATPWMEATNSGQGFPYFDVGPSDFIFAYSIQNDSEITVTPGGS